MATPTSTSNGNEKPRCYLEHVKSCQVCKLVAMEDLCKFKPVRVSDRALTMQRPAPKGTKKQNSLWIRSPTSRLTAFRDNSRFIGYYNPESVKDAISEGIRVAPWEYRAFKEDPDTPRRIYAGDDAVVRESILDNSQPPEEDFQALVTPYDAGLAEDEEVDPENQDMWHDGGFMPKLLFRTIYKWQTVLKETADGYPYSKFEKYPTLRPIACCVELKDGYVVPQGKYVRFSTIKTRADRKRAQDRASERRFLSGFVGKQRAAELTGYIMPGQGVAGGPRKRDPIVAASLMLINRAKKKVASATS